MRVALQGHLPFSAAVKAVHDTLKALRDGVPPADLRDSLAPDEMMAQFTRRAKLPAVDGGFPELNRGFQRGGRRDGAEVHRAL